ncbi:hypothetical protein A2631_04430 [Candidatus Daviesbacteria bacterium RIFCSPHIGHO2_01_FULL_44_29]|uniref:DUF1653 domain-containing protein n=1 Tax=Candidatus Daviesbacteria bacterium RIFCSPHIGHO2_02_FULL_43_12 TaxID=1797776 RepID=A0A1F5KGJ0_9BACT|nr:MAG: hypothetical protein A2631_04430 [Candidatus Daviesbacteria bacterium RIFCSPHIGHO2_01_FULL_44_29]OGE39639.1 MAG: hypothetical protein A3E86_03480 [Candidatus Daviesbacteria bacterium RIFCSPHIGHO2_12_FULL_47_45]OGE39969.1 MAG: hypothetical protein A3D25_04160 [Candidatus Daviesbacteria bacterium RIFCSPHIGHO2_02_FULL_43_12]OGE70350.1 MAG: hypothetical protein A3B55_01410 [Candidatus Daviesbacteria bacterium RIFCSPLOWO2_01_FULL_43_15]
MKTVVKPGKYKHYKGHLCKVIGEATQTETEEPLIVYWHIDQESGKNRLWARPKKMFLENIEVNGKRILRFKYLGEKT